MLLTLLWIAIGAFLVFIDLSTSAFLFSWMAIGAIASMISNLFGVTFLTQVVIFGIVSLIAISIGYPISRKKFKTDIKQTLLMEENYIGMVFDAKENIKEKARIMVSGVYWTGINTGEEIKLGEKFIIKGLEGNKLLIEKYRRD